jgi:hypothetical protein
MQIKLVLFALSNVSIFGEAKVRNNPLISKYLGVIYCALSLPFETHGYAA